MPSQIWAERVQGPVFGGLDCYLGKVVLRFKGVRGAEILRLYLGVGRLE